MSPRIFRVLLRLLPGDFRARFEEEMLDTERSLGPRRRGGLAPLVDLAYIAVALRVDAIRDATLSLSRSRFHMPGTLQDVRFAVRGLARDPLFSAFAIVTLALGIGAGGAVLGVVDRLLLRGPDHVVDAERVVRVYVSHHPESMREFTSAGVGHVTYDLVRTRVRGFESVATYVTNEGTLGIGAEARAVNVMFASASLFPLLGVEPALGRFFSEPEDALESAQRVAVVSHGLWMRDFGGSSDVLGRTVLLAELPYTVIGVAPAGFTGPELGSVDFWVPMNLLSPTITDGWQTSWNAQWMQIVGRIAPNATEASVGTELTREFRAGYTGDEASMRSATLFVAGLGATDSGSEATEARVARWLLIVSGLLLAAVCANLVNLMIARGVKRARELSVRLALGAGRARVRRLLFVEALTLAAAGGVAALVVAWGLGTLGRRTLLADVLWSSPPVDGRLLAAIALTTTLVGLLIGLAPALRTAALASETSLGKGAGDPVGRRALLRSVLSVTQAGLCAALLIGAGLFVKSLANAQGTDLGIEPESALVVELRRAPLSALTPERAAVERARRRTFPVDALSRVASLPGVTHAAVAVGMPFGNRFTVLVREPGRDSLPTLPTGGPSISAVSPDYFRAIGTPIVRGRGFEPAEGASSERVMVVSETLAATVWPGQDALGKCLVAMQDTLPCARVVGVAADTHRGRLREQPSMHYYVPVGQEVGFGGAVFLVRSDGDPLALEPALREALVEMDPSITYVAMQTVQDRIDPQLRPWRLGTSVLASAGVLGLITVMVGMYGVTSYLVTMRTREIGVRVALGASSGDVARLVVGGALLTSVAGALLGGGAAWAAGDFLAPLMFDVSPHDPLVFGGAGVALLLASLLACALPVLRANRIDPIEALRTD